MAGNHLDSAQVQVLGVFLQPLRGQMAGIQPHQLHHLQQRFERQAAFQVDAGRVEHELAAALRHLLQAPHQRRVGGHVRLQHHAKARLVQQDVGIFRQQFGRHVQERAVAAHQPGQRAVGDGRQHALQQGLFVAGLAMEHDLVSEQLAFAVEHRYAQHRQRHRRRHAMETW